MDPPLKNHKILGVSSNTGPDPIINRKASTPVFNVRPLMVFRWRADDGQLIMVLGSSHPSSIKKIPCQSWIHSDKTFCTWACKFHLQTPEANIIVSFWKLASTTCILRCVQLFPKDSLIYEDMICQL